MALADRVAADYDARLRSFGDRAPGRFVAEVAGLTVVGFGVDEPWGTQVSTIGTPVDPDAVETAVEWCRRRGREPWVMARAADRGALAAYDVVDELPALVAPADGEQSVLDIEVSEDLDEFRRVYAASFGMTSELVSHLVVADDLTAHPHLLGRADGTAVACAQLRTGRDLAYASGVGVLPSFRGAGYGAAMMLACRVETAARGCEALWLNASPRSVGFYEAIGFELVDTHLALAAS